VSTPSTKPLPGAPSETGLKSLDPSPIHRSAPVRQRSHGGAEEPMVIPAMGPANHPPGVPIMGAPGRSPHAVMGEPDAAPHLGVMGAGDQGTRTHLFGDSDPRFVDSLFSPRIP
jgi:hypothetical protein